MAIKSAYREKLAEAPNIPEEPPQPSETTRIEFTNGAGKAEPSVAIVSADEDPEPNEATAALLRQLQHLRDSEEALRQHHAATIAARAAMAQQQQAQPPTREQKLAMWKQQGMDPEDARFLAENPQMVDLHDVTRVASEEAEQQGHERGTDAHRLATKEIFDRHVGHQQAQPAASVGPAAADPAGFFEPPEPSAPSPAAPDRAAMYSAPVSRREAGGYREPSPRQVKLSPIEQEIARNLGLSDVAYAEGKIRLQRAKANGEMQ